MAILPCCDKKTYFCIQTVGVATFGTSMFAGIFNPEAFTYTNNTGTLVWAHFRFGWRIWSGKSYLRKPKFILEGWKYIWTMCGNGIGKVIAHRRNNEAARCPKAISYVKALANGFNICFNILSILLNAVESLLNDVERWDGKRFQHFIQQNLASGLVISFRPQLFSRLRNARAPF